MGTCVQGFRPLGSLSEGAAQTKFWQPRISARRDLRFASVYRAALSALSSLVRRLAVARRNLGFPSVEVILSSFEPRSGARCRSP